MPELPEVQTVVSDLNEKIKGDTIIDFWSVWPKAIKGNRVAKFKKEVIGEKIIGLRRIGKNIFIDLSGGKTLYLHLKMTGHLLIKSKIKNQKSKSNKDGYFNDRVNQYIRHSWMLQNKKGEIKSLEFSDMRKFAKIALDSTQNIANLPEIKSLGIDAMDTKFNLKEFNEILDRKSVRGKNIGIALMEQNLISGIGNIYRSEILFAAGVLPERKNESLLPEERKKIFQAIKSILKKAIKLRGTTDSDYRDTSGAPGGFQNVLKVYGKTGEKCSKCDIMLTRAKMGQRSVFYCTGCQK